MPTAVTKRSAETPPQALQRILTSGRHQIEIAVGKAMDADRMIRLAVSAMHQSPGLADCSMVSIANSVMLAAQLRLEINTSLGHAWLIPYKKVCTFQPGYRGLIELAHRSDRVHDVNAHVVYSKDIFELEYGDSPRCLHRPSLAAYRGDALGAYASIRYKGGESPNVYYMSIAKINEIRDKASQSRDSEYGPWKRYPDEMRRKTPTKRLLKYVRLSVDDLARAVGLDDQAEDQESNRRVENTGPLMIAQEMVLEPDMRDQAEEATYELAGSREKQEEVAAEKLSKVTQADIDKITEGRRPTVASEEISQEDLDARNRDIDRKIADAEAGGRTLRKLKI